MDREQIGQEYVFTNFDAENLYTSCLDVQRLDWGLQQEIQLSKLITKLRKWTLPITEGKTKRARALGFIQQGTTFMPLSKFSQEEREQNVLKLNDEFEEVNKAIFENWGELSEMIPLSLFSEKKIEDAGIKFTNCPNKQYFLEYCIKQS